MKAVKFVCDNKQHKQFVATLRANVYNYFKEKGISTKGNFSMAIKTVAMLAMYIAPFIVLLTVSLPFWSMLLLAVLMGIGMAGIGMAVMHDAVHGSYSHKKWLNNLLGGTMYLLGNNVFNWKIQHNIFHHAYSNVEGFDEDISTKVVIRLSEHAPLRKIHKYQHIHAFFFYGFMSIYKLLAELFQLIRYNKAGITRKHQANPTLECTKLIVIKILYLFVFIGLPLLLTDFSWWQVLLGFFVMHWVVGCILSIIFQMAHIVEGVDQVLPGKDGTIENDWVIHELKTTANFARNNRFLNWYIGGLNFQIEHHLFPNICHIHYRKISPIVEKTAREFGFTYNLKPTFFNALVSHIRRLKELGR